jgi:WD40 repeat protein
VLLLIAGSRTSNQACKACGAELWSLDGGARQLSSVSGHSGPINQLAVSQDSERLATSGSDETPRLCPDGHTIATASDDEMIRLWETDPERVAARICRTAQPSFDQAEWQRYGPDVPFRALCR